MINIISGSDNSRNKSAKSGFVSIKQPIGCGSDRKRNYFLLLIKKVLYLHTVLTMLLGNMEIIIEQQQNVL
jgi:hypothetical protein